MPDEENDDSGSLREDEQQQQNFLKSRRLIFEFFITIFHTTRACSLAPSFEV
jgi:hypothetical protein